MIQPSKLAMKKTIDETKLILETYYPSDSKIDVRSAAKEKNILVLNKLTVGEEKELFINTQDSIEQVKRILLLRESQLGMVLFIEDYQKTHVKEDFLKLYEGNYCEIKEFVIPVNKVFEPINFFLLSKML